MSTTTPATGKRHAEAEAALQRVLELFESGELPERIAETVITPALSDAPSNSWSLGNRLLQLLAGTNDARGYRQWQQVNRHVNKGAKAFYILAPCTRTIQEADADGTEQTRTIVTGFTAIPVFRLEDTDGEPLEQPDYRPPLLPPLHEVAERLGVPVSYRPYVAKFLGYYSPGTDEIVLCSHDVRTFFHELAHAAHQRVLKQRGTTLKGGQQAGQEIVADTVAAVLCELFGYSGYLASSHDYIQNYANGSNPAKAAMRLLGEISDVLTLILFTSEQTR
jgi:hypothetical protein